MDITMIDGKVFRGNSYLQIVQVMKNLSWIAHDGLDDDGYIDYVVSNVDAVYSKTLNVPAGAIDQRAEDLLNELVANDLAEWGIHP